MKKMLFLAAAFAAILMTACGGEEKKDDKKEEGKEISEETMKLLEEVKTNFETLNGDLTSVAAGISGKSELLAVSNLDSLKAVVEKWPKDKKAEGLAMMDTLASDNAKIVEIESRFSAESSDWASATKMMMDLEEGASKKSFGDEEAIERAKSLAALIESFKLSIGELKAGWERIKANDEKFKALNQ